MWLFWTIETWLLKVKLHLPIVVSAVFLVSVKQGINGVNEV